MRFFDTFRRSVFSPSFYAESPRGSLGAALGYFLVLIALLTIIKTGTVVVPGLIQLTPQIQKGLQDIAAAYPNNLTITVRGGLVSTNVKEPYAIPIGDTSGSTYPAVTNVVVIDTKTPFSVDQFNRYSTLLWLTGDSIVIGGQSSGQMQTYPLTQVGNFTLDRSTINGWLAAVDPYIGLIAPIVGGLALVGFYIAYLLRLVYLFLLALVIWGLLTVLGVNRTYGESYKLGVYAMTTALLVELILTVFSSQLHYDGFPLMFSAITLFMIVANTLERPMVHEGYTVG